MSTVTSVSPSATSSSAPTAQSRSPATLPKGRNEHYAYYHCRTRGCDARYYPVTDVEREFRRFVERLQPKPEIIAGVCDAAVTAWKKSFSDTERDNAVLSDACLS